jgi:thiamine pyrophosphokinase
MKTKKAFILLNGQKPAVFPDLSNYDFSCAIDGAYNHFKTNNIVPDLVTGDFDSIEAIPDSVEIINTPDQNFTDFEKALQILNKRGYHSIDIYGGSGKEHDHFLGNLSTALLWKNKVRITFFDDYGTYFFIEEACTLNNVLNKTISLIPFPIAQGIKTEGLKFPLQNEPLTFGKRVGTRNLAIDNQVKISINTGELLVYISNLKN